MAPLNPDSPAPSRASTDCTPCRASWFQLDRGDLDLGRYRIKSVKSAEIGTKSGDAYVAFARGE